MTEELKPKIFGTFRLGENFPLCKICQAPLEKFTGFLPEELLNKNSRDLFLEELSHKSFVADSFCEICSNQTTLTFQLVEDTSIPYLKGEEKKN